MNEYDMIRGFAEAFKRSPHQRNRLFECDAELIQIGTQLWALTMDEFSPKEDLFTSEDPELLGENLVTATLSDLFAAGADPAWFMHSISMPKDVDPEFLSAMAEGMDTVLHEAGCSLCGGDFGCADTWRFCGFAMGAVTRERPLTRLIPSEPQSLWVTGKLGDANLAALLDSPTPRFELRIAEAETIKRTATACIDTSGGLFDALWLLHDLNRTLRLELDLDKLPIADGATQIAEATGIPAEAVLLGGAGEYELLFTAPEGTNMDTYAKQIGTVRPSSEPGLFIHRQGECITHVTTPPPCPRDAATIDDHIQEVLQVAETLFGPVTR